MGTREFLEGFAKEASAGAVGAALGAAVGFGAVRGGAAQRLAAGLLGAETGFGLGRGIGGLRGSPDFSGLTQGEREVLVEDAEEMAASRGSRRAQALLLGAAYGFASGTALAAIPAVASAAVGVYGDEAERQGETAAAFRRARKERR